MNRFIFTLIILLVTSLSTTQSTFMDKLTDGAAISDGLAKKKIIRFNNSLLTSYFDPNTRLTATYIKNNGKYSALIPTQLSELKDITTEDIFKALEDLYKEQ